MPDNKCKPSNGVILTDPPQNKCSVCGKTWVRGDEPPDCIEIEEVVVSKVKNSLDAPDYIHKKMDLTIKKQADIIIPTLNKLDLCAETMKFINPQDFNTIVIRGHSYSRANNIGAKAAVTGQLIFCNDDVVIPESVMYELANSEYEIAAAIQFDIKGQPINSGMYINDKDEMCVTKNELQAQVCTSPVYKIKRHIFEEVGGFNEDYINGGEDHDLFYRILQKGYRWQYINTPIIHYESQSAGRFDYLAENIKMLNDTWGIDKLKKFL
jgi:hypothetical protein